LRGGPLADAAIPFGFLLLKNKLDCFGSKQTLAMTNFLCFLP
jgi:hypothetical protein